MKTIILDLIRADIKQTHFIQQLNAIGLPADDHLLNLSSVILNIMEIHAEDPIVQDAIQMGYINVIREACTFVHDKEELERRAEMIYCFLSELQVKPSSV